MKTKSFYKQKLVTLFSVVVLTSVIMLMSNCGGSSRVKVLTAADSLKGLKDFYIDYFPVGVAVSPRSLQGEQGEFIKKHFNSLTAENVMKPALLQPEEGRFDWTEADKIVEFAQANGMKVRGHTLCWHDQTGAWMFKDSDGNQASKELVLSRLKEHITQVVTRYKGKIYTWDVLNEAIDNADPSIGYRVTPWYTICGEEFIAKAFQWAHEADPEAILFYNDINTEHPVKREKIYELVKKLLDQGVPIHGVGLQGHWNIGGPRHSGQLHQPGEGEFEIPGSSEDAIRESIDKFASLGLLVHITELDVSIYKSKYDTINPGFTPEREQQQIDFYKMAFNVFREKKDIVTSVTFWNLSDRFSWLDNRTPRRKHYPLLFDADMKPKKVFWEIVKF
ncbi:MAG TPA: endo-1,4-beta-xylanase [Bacteroidales bacterium]|jgi:endo-1,4-beta-xylanase|nr:endo-1,4-beta-xylanase [Bacteroidales bacterium]HQB36585.1 endo-1,4-beta-xylanase [Bacteroidales bacterium]